MASPSGTTSAYFWSMSNRLASMTAGVRSATASRTTMQRMSRMNASVTVARTQPLTLVLLANSDGLQWDTRFDEAAVERSPFATAFLAAFPGRAHAPGP